MVVTECPDSRPSQLDIGSVGSFGSGALTELPPSSRGPCSLIEMEP
jgi:hypothetical protein